MELKIVTSIDFISWWNYQDQLFFSVRYKNLKDQRKNHLEKLWGTCKVWPVFNSIVHDQSKRQLLWNQTKPNQTKSWALKPFVSWFIVSQPWTRMVIISSNSLMTTSSFPIKLSEKRFFIGSHFEKLQVRNILLIKETFNYVNLKSIFNYWENYDIVRLY